MSYTNRAILLFLSAIFLLTSFDKMLHYDGFVNALRDYRMVPRWTAHYFAAPVILIELAIGIGLLLRPWRRVAALTAAGMLAVFSLVLGLNYLLGGRGICGCWFTFTLSQSTGMHIIQNLTLCILALMLWTAFKYEPGEAGHRPPLLTSTPTVPSPR